MSSSTERLLTVLITVVGGVFLVYNALKTYLQENSFGKTKTKEFEARIKKMEQDQIEFIKDTLEHERRNN